MTKRPFRFIAILGSTIPLACASGWSSEEVDSSHAALSGASDEDGSLGATELAVWNTSVAAGECTGPKGEVEPCWMTTHVNETRSAPAAPAQSGIAFGVKIGTEPLQMHQATILNWGIPSTPFYDGTAVVSYGTDAAISYVKRDTFVVTAIVDAAGEAAKGTILTFTEDAGKSWSTPQWVHRGCDVFSTRPSAARFWNTRHSSAHAPKEGEAAIVVSEVGHDMCCPIDGPTSPTVCGGDRRDGADFGAFDLSQKPEYLQLNVLEAVNDGFVREDTKYLNMTTTVDSELCWDIVAAYPTTEDSAGKGASPLNGACPNASTFDVTWRTQWSRMCLGTLGTFSPWKRGPDIDRDDKSPRCLGQRRNSWLPAMAATHDGKWIAAGVPVTTVVGQRIRVRELDSSSFPPGLVGSPYTTMGPSTASRETDQFMPQITYALSDGMENIALTWIDDRDGQAVGDFGSMVGVGGASGSHVSDLAPTGTVLVPYKLFATTGIQGERFATHVGLGADESQQRGGFAGTMSKGDRLAFTTFRP